MIRAEVHDDEFKLTARFDATPWFAQASDDDILDLAIIGWRGDAPADKVAEFFEGMPTGEPSVDDVFASARQHDCGFDVSVEPNDALTWVKANRPQLMDKMPGPG
ncbi:MAG: hypothetical protein JSS66_05905 [Armatimonadetes bacterium]|nr:hypothetical protein [Armatimonadota bacterium]